MTESNPAKQCLTCANDHDGITCELCIALMASSNHHQRLAASANELAILVSNLWGKNHKIYCLYDVSEKKSK
jgi:hypothetical protein